MSEQCGFDPDGGRNDSGEFHKFRSGTPKALDPGRYVRRINHEAPCGFGLGAAGAQPLPPLAAVTIRSRSLPPVSRLANDRADKEPGLARLRGFTDF